MNGGGQDDGCPALAWPGLAWHGLLERHKPLVLAPPSASSAARCWLLAAGCCFRSASMESCSVRTCSRRWWMDGWLVWPGFPLSLSLTLPIPPPASSSRFGLLVRSAPPAPPPVRPPWLADPALPCLFSPVRLLSQISTQRPLPPAALLLPPLPLTTSFVCTHPKLPRLLDLPSPFSFFIPSRLCLL